jgi:glucuronoarabinoxylan endo-1,4-beta-xylanase
MKIKNIFWSFLIFGTVFLLCCKKGGSEPIPDPITPDPVLPKITIAIDKSTKYQTIEGFGFFGGADVWWAGAGSVWNDAWGEKVISDLGITIWRNELFPPAIPGANQDADWGKQKPVVQGLKAKADKYKVDLKFIATVWSPPADLKWDCNFTWAGDQTTTRRAGNVSTKNGGTLNPNKYTEYADWLKSHLQLYKDAGVDLYALSLQNELMFKQTFNSCTYTISWYNDLLVAVVPKVKANFPNVKIFGSENMLEMEGRDDNWKWFYHSGIKANSDATKNIDILAVHGYSDGVAASSGSALVKMWINHKEQFSNPMNKQAWMTETSGYSDFWEKTGDKPGALNLAMDIHSALYYGNISAWVWWQGSQAKSDEFSLMSGTVTGKKYSISKHFYRYIRPGAVRVKSTTADLDFFVTAYENQAKGAHTIIIINSGSADKSVSLTGPGLPNTFKMYRTNSGAENCLFIKDVVSGSASNFAVPAKSIVTLQAGGDAL